MIEIIPDIESNYTMQPKIISNWWYFHGKLEDDIGFDKGIMLDNNQLKSLKFTDKDIPKEYEMFYLPNGIYDVKVNDKPCIGYFWTIFNTYRNIDGIIPNMHGLVCYKDDIKANKYAYNKFIEKSEIL